MSAPRDRYRVVRFGVARGQQPVSHVEWWDQEDDEGRGSWRRLTLHLPDALAEDVAARLNAAPAIMRGRAS